MNIFQSIRSHAAFWPAVAMNACSPAVELGSNLDDASTAATTAGTGGAAGGGGTEGTGGLAGTGDDAGPDAAEMVACPVPGGRSPTIADTDGAANPDGAADAGGFCGPANNQGFDPDPACVLKIVDKHTFARGTVLLTNGRSTAKLNYTPGTPGTPESFCVSGRAEGPSPTETGIIISLAESDPQAVPTIPFDLPAHGISKIRFSLIQDRPVTGVHVSILAISPPPCPNCGGLYDLLKGRTDHLDPQGVVCPGTTTAAFSDFTPRIYEDPKERDANHALDPTLVTGMLFFIQPVVNESFDYRFCVHFAFLDANDREVTR